MRKIIDGKGMLFGKINVIDFSVILFLIYLIPIFYFGYKIFNKRQFVDQIKTQLAMDKEKENESFIKQKRNIISRINALENRVDIISGYLMLQDRISQEQD